ncbi:MAG: hypothetical protein IKM61_03350 [Eubacteriaceae bacterium]|nr:hypothetical protein [Eubacteriaceae bacterium]
MSIYEVFDKLQQEVENAGSVPLTSKVMIDKDLFLDLLDELKELLPPEVIQAKKVLDDAEGIISRAKGEAEAIVNEAVVKKNEILDISSITQEAQARADAITKKARVDAYKIRLGSLEQSHALMNEAREEVGKVSAVLEEYCLQLERSKESLNASVRRKPSQGENTEETNE